MDGLQDRSSTSAPRRAISPSQVALANPHLTGIGFDLPEVAPIFEEYAAANGVADRVTFAAASFFTDPLPKADVVMMGHILHDWDLAQKKDADPQGLRGAARRRRASSSTTRSSTTTGRQNAFGLMMSLNMLIETPGGFDYTGADCIGWMKEAGFRTPASSTSSAPTRWSSASSKAHTRI